jgi:putative heme-binding domain-containing protein
MRPSAQLVLALAAAAVTHVTGLPAVSPDAARAPVYSAFTPLTRPNKPAAQLGSLSPAEAAKSFHVADDLVFEQVLAEPLVAQPVFLTFDERGRMWVVQYRQYPQPAGLKMVSRDNFWRAVYDKVPPPPPRHFKGADKITIHEDTDGNGTFDKHTTFVDGLNIATSVAFGRGGVFVLNPPYLLFYPDKNRDDVPDGDPRVLLSGFGLEDTHSVANSLRWGPDGWLYGCQGSTVTGHILVHGADGKVLEEEIEETGSAKDARPHPSPLPRGEGAAKPAPANSTAVGKRDRAATTPVNPPAESKPGTSTSSQRVATFPRSSGERAGVRAGVESERRSPTRRESTEPMHAGSESGAPNQARRPMRPIYSQGQNIWRYHPEKRIYEIFSEGGGNAFGLEMDSAGRIFSGHNGGNTRGFHYMQGAYLQKGFDKHGPLSNPYALGYFPQMPHPDVDRFTHNFVIYDSGALGERYQGKLFGVEPLQGRIVLGEITPDGSTFRTRNLGHPVTSDDKWFRPVDIKLGPDGALYVCDWYDRQVNHYRNHEGQMDASNGRIYRLRAKHVGQAASLPAAPTALSAKSGRFAPAELTTAQLVNRLWSQNRWLRSEALRMLAERSTESALVPLLDEIVVTGDYRELLARSAMAAERTNSAELQPPAPQATAAINVLWAIHQTGQNRKPWVTRALRNPEPLIRQWMIRLLGDDRSLARVEARIITDLAATEPNIEVRAQLASTAKRLPAADCLAIVRNLLGHDRDVGDPRQPLLLWWAIEDKCASDRDAVLALFADRELWRAPLVQQHVLSRLMRRFAATGKRDDLLTCAQLFALSPGPDQTAQLTRGFEEAYQGRPMVGLPEELLSAMERAGGESVLIGARRGQPAAVAQALALVADPQAEASKRLQLIQVLGETKQASAVPMLLTVARDAKQADLRKAALGALQAYDSPDIAGEILTQLASYPNDVRTAAFGLLASRGTWALALLQAVNAGRLEKAAVPNDVVRRIKALVEVGQASSLSPGLPVRGNITDGQDARGGRLEARPTLSALLAKHWPNLRQATSTELEKEIARLAEVVNLTTGSPYNGKKLFLENCGVCHKLFTKGGEIGPDLTVYQRDDLPNLLLNIVNPNAEIREGYESFSVETKDGRSLTGFRADQDAQVVILRTPDGQTLPLPRGVIVSMEPAGTSLMPEGLLSNLSDQQVRDLFAYLRSTQPLNDGN